MVRVGWHILRVASGQEVPIARACQAVCYVPRRRVRHFDRRKRVTVSRTIVAFPGYVFVNTPQPRSVKIAPGKGYRAFMRNSDGSYATLDPRSFDLLMALEQELLVEPMVRIPDHMLRLFMEDPLLDAVVGTSDCVALGRGTQAA